MGENSNRPGSSQNCYLPENTILDGRYRILRVLGMGGFGITYEAINEKVNRHVAVKEFWDRDYMERQGTKVAVIDETAGERFRDIKSKFLREARRLGDFTTEQGIVHVLDYFETNNTAYIVMEYVSGITLAQYLQQSGQVAPQEMFRLLFPLMETLDKVHKNGVIHRDISPDNIKLVRTENGETSVKLLDFGSARAYADNKTYTIELKEGYAPLEQYSDSEQGPWTDVYALCAVIYRGITGEKPISATVRAMNGILLMPSQRGITIDARLERILKKGLSLQRESRYQSIEEMLAELKPILEPKKKKRTGKKNIFFLGISCACCVLGASAFFGWNYYKTHQAFFKFHGKETTTLLLAPYDNVGAQDYQKDIKTMKSRLDIAVGEENYILTEKEDGLKLEIPVEFFEEQKEEENNSEDKEQSLEEYINDYITEKVAAAHRKAITVIEPKENGSYDISRETLNDDDIVSVEKRKGKFPIEYYLPAEIGSNPEKAESYVEVKISEKAAKRIKESLQKRLQSGKGENRSYMFLTTDPCYPELMNYTLGTDLNGDWTTYYRPLFSDDDKWKLLWQDFTLSETYQVLNADNMEADWEEQSDMWGAFQHKAEDIKGPFVCAEYISYDTADIVKKRGDGNWLETIYDLKKRLDTLEIPYAFGTFPEGRNKFAVKIAQKDVSRFILEKLRANLSSSDLKLSADDDRGDDFDDWDWQVQFKDSDDIALRYEPESVYEEAYERNQLKEWEESVKDRIVLKVWDYELAAVNFVDVEAGKDLKLNVNLQNDSHIFEKKDIPLLKFIVCVQNQFPSPLSNYYLTNVRYFSKKNEPEKEAQEENKNYEVEMESLKKLKSMLSEINEEAEAEEAITISGHEIEIRLNRNTYGEEYGEQTVMDIEALFKNTDWLKGNISLKIFPGNRTDGENISIYQGWKDDKKEWELFYEYTDSSNAEQQKIEELLKKSSVLQDYVTENSFVYGALWW